MKGRWAGIVVNVLLLVVTAVLYDRLADVVPTHWNMRGEVDGTMSKFPGAFLPSVMGLALCVLMPLLRQIDPRSRNYARFDDTFYLVVNAVALLMAVLQAMTLAMALGYGIDVARWLTAGLGIMYIVLGNFMPRIRSNWWMGIRTPWTLENEDVWRRTHRFGGRAFVLGGVIILLAGLLPRTPAAYISFAAMILAALAPAAYSYVVWRQERRNA